MLTNTTKFHYRNDATGQMFAMRVEERGRPFLGYFWCVATYDRFRGEWHLCDIDWAESRTDADAKLRFLMLDEDYHNEE